MDPLIKWETNSEPVVKPYAIVADDKKTADVFIEGPLEEILVADFDFVKDRIRTFGKVTSHMLLQMHYMFNDLKKEVSNESEDSNSDS